MNDLFVFINFAFYVSDIKIYHIKYEKKIDIITDLNIKYDTLLVKLEKYSKQFK